MVDQTDPLLIVKSWLRISDGTARVFCPYDASRNSLAKYFITEVCEEMGGSEASHLVLNADNIQSAVYNAKDIVEIERRISRKSVDEEYNRIRSNLDCDGEADRRYFVSVTKDGTRKWMEVDFQDIRSTEKPDIERGERVPFCCQHHQPAEGCLVYRVSVVTNPRYERYLEWTPRSVTRRWPARR